MSHLILHVILEVEISGVIFQKHDECGRVMLFYRVRVLTTRVGMVSSSRVIFSNTSIPSLPKPVPTATAAAPG